MQADTAQHLQDIRQLITKNEIISEHLDGQLESLFAEVEGL